MFASKMKCHGGIRRQRCASSTMVGSSVYAVESMISSLMQRGLAHESRSRYRTISVGSEPMSDSISVPSDASSATTWKRPGPSTSISRSMPRRCHSSSTVPRLVGMTAGAGELSCMMSNSNCTDARRHELRTEVARYEFQFGCSVASSSSFTTTASSQAGIGESQLNNSFPLRNGSAI